MTRGSVLDTGADQGEPAAGPFELAAIRTSGEHWSAID